ncbi:MAG: ComEC/Rec2 family competence protein [Patescibacteria group bacterium]
MNSSRIFLYSVVSFLFGVLFASYIPFARGIAYGTLVFLVGGLIFWMVRRDRRILVASIALGFFVFGVFRFSAVMGEPPELSVIVGTRVSIEGFVNEEPRIRAMQEVVFRAQKISGKEIIDPFLILITVRPYPRYAIGDALVMNGVVMRPENISEFDYSAYLAKDDIYAISRYPLIEKKDEVSISFMLAGKKKLAEFKNAFVQKIKILFPEPHASYLAGLLVGDRSGIPKELYEAFKRTGTAHVVALSGFNITIIISSLALVFNVFSVPFYLSGVLLSIFIILFSIMVGGEPSIVRAAFMGIIVVFARQNFRMYDSVRALLLAGTIMVFMNPKLLRFDIGFQLSFAATAGIIFFSPFFERKLLKINSPYIRTLLATTLSAQCAVFPLLLVYFGGVSLISPLANIMMLPTVPFAMLFGFIATSLGFISHALSFVVVPFAWIVLAYEIIIVSFFSALPFAYTEIPRFVQWVFLIFFVFLIGKLVYRSSYVKN